MPNSRRRRPKPPVRPQPTFANASSAIRCSPSRRGSESTWRPTSSPSVPPSRSARTDSVRWSSFVTSRRSVQPPVSPRSVRLPFTRGPTRRAFRGSEPMRRGSRPVKPESAYRSPSSTPASTTTTRTSTGPVIQPTSRPTIRQPSSRVRSRPPRWSAGMTSWVTTTTPATKSVPRSRLPTPIRSTATVTGPTLPARQRASVWQTTARRSRVRTTDRRSAIRSTSDRVLHRVPSSMP